MEMCDWPAMVCMVAAICVALGPAGPALNLSDRYNAHAMQLSSEVNQEQLKGHISIAREGIFCYWYMSDLLGQWKLHCCTYVAMIGGKIGVDLLYMLHTSQVTSISLVRPAIVQ